MNLYMCKDHDDQSLNHHTKTQNSKFGDKECWKGNSFQEDTW